MRGGGFHDAFTTRPTRHEYEQGGRASGDHLTADQARDSRETMVLCTALLNGPLLDR
jgi:hypothetical protein